MARQDSDGEPHFIYNNFDHQTTFVWNPVTSHTTVDVCPKGYQERIEETFELGDYGISITGGTPADWMGWFKHACDKYLAQKTADMPVVDMT